MLMPANFSSIVGEFMNSGIPKHCPTLVKNQYHNGHPDLLPAGMFPDDAAQHAGEGIEVKGSRYLRGWQLTAVALRLSTLTSFTNSFTGRAPA